MDKSIAGLIGAVGALAAAGPAHAVPSASLVDAMRIESYADLLKPIPNALAVRQALAEGQTETAPADVITVQYYRHHHHHHHRYYRRRSHHHHHHHHSYYR